MGLLKMMKNEVGKRQKTRNLPANGVNRRQKRKKSSERMSLKAAMDMKLES